MSRATIRAAVGRLVGRGLLVRRQGSGTFLARLPEQEGQPSPVGIKLGSNVAELGRLETYTSIAERLGVKAESDHLHVEAARSTPEDAPSDRLSLGVGSRSRIPTPAVRPVRDTAHKRPRLLIWHRRSPMGDRNAHNEVDCS